MTSELRPAVEVWRQAHQALYWLPKGAIGEQGAAAVIQAYGDEREAKGREEQAAELAKWKALAETLAGAVTEAREALHFHYVEWDGEPEDAVPLQLARSKCDAALTSYKEQRDD